MIVCGWCGQPTKPGPTCTSCGRDPALPYSQRAQVPPAVDPRTDVRRRLAEAQRALGPAATVERIAEYLDVSPRTVRRWREMSA